MSKPRTLEEFRSFIDAIPTEKWGTRLIEFQGKRCSMAHVGTLGMNWAESKEYLASIGIDFRKMVDENDGNPKAPKAAVLNYIDSLINLSNGTSTTNSGGVQCSEQGV